MRRFIPNSLEACLREDVKQIIAVAIGPNSSWYMQYVDNNGHHKWHSMGVPQALFDILTDAKYTESVSLGPNGAYFWKGTYGGRHCYRYLTHLPQLDGLIRIEQDDNGRILHSVSMGRTSGIALFTDGVWRSWDLSPNVMNVLRLTPKYIRNIYLSSRNDEDFVVEWMDGSVAFSVREDLLSDLQELVNSMDSAVPRSGWDGWEFFQGWQGRVGWEGFQGWQGWGVPPVYRRGGNGFSIEVARSAGNEAISGIASSVYPGCVIM